MDVLKENTSTLKNETNKIRQTVSKAGKSMTAWDHWKLKNKGKLVHIAGFEEKFVDLILTRIPEITPEDVIPQYYFMDNRGKDRYIDFMILNHTKGYCLPLELDGYEKMVGNGAEYYKFNDFLERQNAMITKFGIVLRYTNKAMFNENAKIIREIRDTLLRQSQHKSTQDIRDRHVGMLIQDYEGRLKEINKQTANDFSSLLPVVNNMQTELLNLREQIKVQKENKESSKQTLIYSSIILLIFIGLGFWWLGANRTQTSNDPSLVQAVATVQENVVEEETHLPSHTEPAPTNEQKQLVVHATETADIPSPKIIEPIVEQNTPELNQYTVGAYQEVCGNVAQVTDFAKGVYLNLGNRYPKQDATIVVWNSTSTEAATVINTHVCATGKVDEYKNKPRISIQSLAELK